MPTSSPSPEQSPVPPHDQFAPFSVSAQQPWDVARVCHLLRRAGFGPTEVRLNAMLKQSPQDAVESLFAYDPDDDPFNGMAEQLEGLLNLNLVESVQRWWVYRMINTPRPLQEKIALFWHNRFATSAAKVGNGLPMHNQIEIFRRQGL